MVITRRVTDVHPYFVRSMDLVGDGTGEHNAAVDGSVTPQLFKISPPAAGAIVLTQLTTIIEMSGTFRTNTYGSLAELTNGVQVGFFNDSTGDLISDITSQHPIKKNCDWTVYAYPVALCSWGAGNSHLLSKWNMIDSCTAIMLAAGSGIAVGVKIRDDLSSINHHCFTVHGYSKS